MIQLHVGSCSSGDTDVPHGFEEPGYHGFHPEGSLTPLCRHSALNAVMEVHSNMTSIVIRTGYRYHSLQLGSLLLPPQEQTR
mmetsp:Transcript_104403/g.304766  ORF Transcript_104403/g.304766 Transcript_104403/m.304766 type:complete len:82 (+) Transcript_104403:131-376(+)